MVLSIERQIGSEDPRLWMLIHRTIDFTVPIVQQVIEDYVTNMRDDTVYWQTQSDGTTKGEFAHRYFELSTLVMKLYYRLLDALEDEVLAYIETQQVARNGCEILRLAKVEICSRNTIHRNRSHYEGAHLDFRQERSGTINHRMGEIDSSIEHSA